MPITLGVDVGTTTITALALDTATGLVLASATLPNNAETTAPADKARGRSEWDAGRMARIACGALREATVALGARGAEVCGIGVTGQQHGTVLLDAALESITPFFNWQDQRGQERVPGSDHTYVEEARGVLGSEAARRAGCALSTGYLGATLFWMRETGTLPAGATACFIADFLGSVLTGEPPVCDATNGASSGLLNLERRAWDDAMVAALGLPPEILPPVREAGERLGALTPRAAGATGLPAGIPVFVGLGDNQASFLGSVARRDESLLANIGTGAQVSRYTDRVHDAAPLETRPFPRGGYLLVQAGLSGGRSYALLQRFFRQVGTQVLGIEAEGDLYATMNALAAEAPPGADGLRCEPAFAGTRHDPGRRAAWSGASEANFTPAHLVRALLEGMARSLREAGDHIRETTGAGWTRLVGAGNGLRENRVLAGIAAAEFGMPLAFPRHREEAAYGAALVAGVGAGVWPDLDAAGQVIPYQAV